MKAINLILENGNLWYGNVRLGAVYQEVDGYYVFVPEMNGAWSSHYLREIADFLDNLNAEWDAEVQEYFGG